MKLSNRSLGQFTRQLARQLVGAGLGRTDLQRALLMDRSTATKYIALSKRNLDPFPCVNCGAVAVCPAVQPLVQARAAVSRAARLAREVEAAAVFAVLCPNFEPYEGVEDDAVDLAVGNPADTGLPGGGIRNASGAFVCSD